MEDRELLRQYAESHSEEAFRKLVDRHLPMVYSVAMRIVRDQELSEEIAQNAFKKLAEAASQVGRAQVVGGWLYNTARNLALNALRGERRRRERETIAGSMQTPDSSSGQITEDLEAMMAELDPEDRDLLLLRFLESRSFGEVGRELGITEEAARKRVTRALDRLRAIFENEGTTVSAVGLGTGLSAITLAVPPHLSAAILTQVFREAATVTSSATALATLPKVLLSGALIIAVAVAVYEARQVSRLRRDLATMEERRSQLAVELEGNTRQLDEATQRLAAVRARNDLLQQNSSELLRLRNEVGMLRRERLAGGSSYRGKSVIEWLREYDAKRHDLTDEAKNAFRQIGSKAVPELLSALLSSKMGYNEETSSTNNIAPWQVTCAFRALGPLGKPAVPALTEYLRNSDSDLEWLRIQAAACLGFIGPEAKAALPELLKCVDRKEDDGLRMNSIGALVRIGGDPSVLLPVFISNLSERSSELRDWAATGIAKYGADAASAIPALIEGLSKRDEEARVLSGELKAIGAIGPTTNDITPVLQKFLRYQHEGVRMAATNALNSLAPQFSAQAVSN